MLAPTRVRLLALVVLLGAPSGLVACKRRVEVRALESDDGKSKKQKCELSAGGVIAKDTVVPAGCVVAVAETYFVRNGATLTVEAGAKLSFAKGARLHVEDGALIAKGTAGDPVLFTSSAPTPAAGDWGGLVFAATQKPSTLEHVLVEWAGAEPPAAPPAVATKSSYGFGGASGQPLAARRPAVHLTADAAKLTFVASTIKNAARVGLTADGDDPFAKFDAVTFLANGGFAMDVLASALGSVTSIDTSEPVRIRGAVTHSQKWPLVSGGIVVASLRITSPTPAKVPTETTLLTLAPETVLRMEPRSAIFVGDYSSSGALVATKTRFTSAADKPARGDWAGLRFGKRAPGTAIDGCTIEFAGFSAMSAAAKPSPGKKPTAPAALEILEHMKDFAVVRTTFRDNAGPGMGLSDTYFVFIGGTGGCEGLDAPKNGNKSIGQPLCEYHEDPFAALGAFGSGGLSGALSDTALSPGSYGMIGTAGSGMGGGGGAVGGGGLGGIGGLGHGAGTGSGYGSGGGLKAGSAGSGKVSPTKP